MQSAETQKFHKILERLKQMDFEKINQEEREELKVLAEQYQFHLQQFQDFFLNLNETQ